MQLLIQQLMYTAVDTTAAAAGKSVSTVQFPNLEKYSLIKAKFF